MVVAEIALVDGIAHLLALQRLLSLGHDGIVLGKGNLYLRIELECLLRVNALVALAAAGSAVRPVPPDAAIVVPDHPVAGQQLLDLEGRVLAPHRGRSGRAERIDRRGGGGGGCRGGSGGGCRGGCRGIRRLGTHRGVRRGQRVKRRRALGIIHSPEGVAVFGVAVERGPKGVFQVLASVGRSESFPIVSVVGDIVAAPVAQVEDDPVGGVVEPSLATPGEGRGPVRIVDVEELVATAPDGTIRLHLEEQAPAELPVRFLARVANRVLPRFSVQLVRRGDPGELEHRRGDVHGPDDPVEGRPGLDPVGIVDELGDPDPSLVQGSLGVHPVVLLKEEDGVFQLPVVFQCVQQRTDGIVEPYFSEVVDRPGSTEDRLAVVDTPLVLRHSLDPGILAVPVVVGIRDVPARILREGFLDVHRPVGNGGIEVQEKRVVLEKKIPKTEIGNQTVRTKRKQNKTAMVLGKNTMGPRSDLHPEMFR
mmetsp:Transcript_86196/g.175039  ORF Transcript_86196/g.175039 Transcript_86196/m.175039 type:complete len:478 (+) Transcript_86196:1316-2749(+)